MNSLDSDDLNDCYKGPEGEQGEKNDLFAHWNSSMEENRKGEQHAVTILAPADEGERGGGVRFGDVHDYIKENGDRCHACVEGNSYQTGPVCNRRIPLFRYLTHR